LFSRQSQCTGNGARFVLEIDRMSQINHENLVASVHHHLQLPGHDAGYTQAAQKAPALEILPANPGKDERNQYDDCQTAKALGIVENLFKLIAEDKPEQHEGADPEEGPGPVIDYEWDQWNAIEARERRRHCADAGNKLGDQEGLRPVTRERILSA